MISFIIIGLNEGWKLTQCFKSIFKTIEYNKLKEYEIIYVDSNSTDNSIEIAKKFKEIKILKITGPCSVALGRNTGAREAKGDILYFFDADIELVPDFLKVILDNTHNLKYNIVAGKLINYYYDVSGNLVKKEKLNKNHKNKTVVSIGGIHIMKKKIWDIAGENRTKFKNAFEDTDLSLRLYKKKINSFKVKDIMAIHHTINYRDKSRIWKMLFSGQQTLRAVLYRDHFFNRNCYRILFRQDSTLLILIISLILMFTVNTNAIIVYPFLVILRIFFQKDKKTIMDVIMRISYYFIRDVIVLISFLSYYPKNIQTSYKIISDKKKKRKENINLKGINL